MFVESSVPGTRGRNQRKGAAARNPWYLRRCTAGEGLAGLTLLVTGGAGFLGSHYIRYALQMARPAVVGCADTADPARRLVDIQDSRFRWVNAAEAGFDVSVDLDAGRIVRSGVWVEFRIAEAYGPYQHPSELIPRLVLAALHGRFLDVPGDGTTRRGWILVHDVVRAVHMLVERGQPGVRYEIGGRGSERTDLEVAKEILRITGGEQGRIRLGGAVSPPRPAVDPSRIETELGFRASLPFEVGLRTTVDWYRRNESWARAAAAGA